VHVCFSFFCFLFLFLSERSTLSRYGHPAVKQKYFNVNNFPPFPPSAVSARIIEGCENFNNGHHIEWLVKQSFQDCVPNEDHEQIL
jgi:hypothetical protein